MLIEAENYLGSSSAWTSNRHRAQLATCSSAYLYREKLGNARVDAPEARGVRRDRGAAAHRQAGAPATTTPADPFGTHLCVAPDQIARIYSTSGTTGTPSYIPLTASDLDNYTGSARSYAASGVEAGQRIVSTYNASSSQGAALSPPSTGSASPTSRSATRSTCSARSKCFGPSRWRPPTPPT